MRVFCLIYFDFVLCSEQVDDESDDLDSVELMAFFFDFLCTALVFFCLLDSSLSDKLNIVAFVCARLLLSCSILKARSRLSVFWSESASVSVENAFSFVLNFSNFDNASL